MLPEIDISEAWARERYAKYLAGHASASFGKDDVTLAANSLAGRSDDVSLEAAFEGAEGPVIVTGAQSEISFDFSVKSGGLYELRFIYYLPGETGVPARRSIRLDGELPFREAADVVFPRMFVNEGGIAYRELPDGTQVKSELAERLGWQSLSVEDPTGISARPLRFYLSEGRHTLSITSQTQDMLIEKIIFTAPTALLAYEDYLTEMSALHGSPDKAPGAEEITVEAEEIDVRSSSIYGSADLSSPDTQPYSAKGAVINYLSGGVFKKPNDRVSYKTDAKAGWYKLSFKYRQSERSGGFSSRRLLIDGEVPFSQADAMRFGYSMDWDNIYLGGGDPCYIYLSEGEHTLTLEATSGDLSPFIGRAQEIIDALNRIYHSLFIIIGPSPDPFRDYRFTETAAEELKELAALQARLSALGADITALTGQKGAFLSALDQMNVTIKSIIRAPDSIATRLNGFIAGIGSFTEWMMSLQGQPMDLDYMQLLPPGADPAPPISGFFKKLAHHIRMFLRTFGDDYDSAAETGGKPVTVWLGATGRDQAGIVRQMILERFTPEYGVPVKLQFITGALLPSTLAGIGPDVYMFATSDEPINYALRGAVEPLDGFDGFLEVAARFSPAATQPFTYRGKTYALPETEQFPMLFYRADILTEMDIPVPETWNDVYNALSRLQSKNLTIGIPVDFTGYYMFLYQNGGQIYQNAGEAVNFGDKRGIAAFGQWTDFFVSYKLSTAYSFVNRFRTGEMALGIADFITAAQLYVSAPEIRGMWRMAPLPGVKNAGGDINRTVPVTTTANIIMRQSKHKENAWAFLKWWSSAATQADYAAKLEQTMGLAARYPTANLEAFARQDWDTPDAQALALQRGSLAGVPEAPGSYIVPRYINFAFSEVVDEGADAGIALLDYTEKMNAELARKRREFDKSVGR